MRSRTLPVLIALAALGLALALVACSAEWVPTAAPCLTPEPGPPCPICTPCPTAADAEACTVVTPAPVCLPCPTAVPCPACPLPAEGIDLGGGRRLVTAQVDTEAADLALQLRTPWIEGGPSAVTGPFNAEVSALVLRQVAELERDAAAFGLGGGSDLWISYSVPYASDPWLSVRIDVSLYITGAAHPNSYTRGVTYDLSAAQVLELVDLFQPGADYLGALSAYCIDDLRAQGVLEWEDGALPAAENYAYNWNLAPGGLLITFDPYAVASYAAGPQTVTIPYAELAAIAAPGGPLAQLGP